MYCPECSSSYIVETKQKKFKCKDCGFSFPSTIDIDFDPQKIKHSHVDSKIAVALIYFKDFLDAYITKDAVSDYIKTVNASDYSYDDGIDAYGMSFDYVKDMFTVYFKEKENVDYYNHLSTLTQKVQKETRLFVEHVIGQSIIREGIDRMFKLFLGD